MTAQISFPLPAQPRNRRAEPAAFYDAVRALRRHGLPVYRAGITAYRVGNRLVSARELCWLAREMDA